MRSCLILTLSFCSLMFSLLALVSLIILRPSIWDCIKLILFVKARLTLSLMIGRSRTGFLWLLLKSLMTSLTLVKLSALLVIEVAPLNNASTWNNCVFKASNCCLTGVSRIYVWRPPEYLTNSSSTNLVEFNPSCFNISSILSFPISLYTSLTIL